MSSIQTAFRDSTGREVGRLTVARLPGRSDLLERDDERLILQEEGTYVFQIDVADGTEPLILNPGPELFSFDTARRDRGRLQPRQHVGRIVVSLGEGSSRGTATLSVRPKKLDAETEYRQMLDDIAEVATEAILQGFAPAAVALEPDADLTPRLLYQQFAFLHARLRTSGRSDIGLIANRPHTSWIDYDENRPPGAPVRGSTRTLRSLTKPGPRIHAPSSYPISSLPSRMLAVRSEETLDTEPNRFIHFALQRWRGLAQKVFDVLDAQPSRPGPVSRGIDAAEEMLELLDEALHLPLFRDVGVLNSFPGSNQVLQKRAGYRDLFRTFALAEIGARMALDWDLDDVFGASQRNIATLYEYWAFLQLARCIGGVCGRDQTADVLESRSDGLSLSFRRGKHSKLAWSVAVRNRELTVELYFNREFLASAQPDSSWTRAMRPDCSLRIAPSTLIGDVAPSELAVWLHFDAKYRVEYISEQFSAPPGDDGLIAVEAERIESIGTSRREDLLKMHAYRDSIRRSAGAYVLYPGSQHQPPFHQHHEVLPGLGAFVLRPGASEAVGRWQLEQFLSDVLLHVADRATQHERSRYWQAQVHRRRPQPVPTDRPFPSLRRPPSDVLVMCGYVRGRRHADWIRENGLYNVRAGRRRGAVTPDAAVLQADDLVLYGREMEPALWQRRSAWFVQSRDDLIALDYPKPRGEVYLCCEVEPHDSDMEWLSRLDLGNPQLSAGPAGAPFALTWQQLLETAPADL